MQLIGAIRVIYKVNLNYFRAEFEMLYTNTYIYA